MEYKITLFLQKEQENTSNIFVLLLNSYIL